MSRVKFFGPSHFSHLRLTKNDQGRCVVKAVSFFIHAARHWHALQGMLVGFARVLTSPVRVVEQAWRWVASIKRHVECGQRQVRGEAAAHLEPTTIREYRSKTTARYNHPSAVVMNVMSAVQTVFGSATSNCRTNRFSAMGEA